MLVRAVRQKLQLIRYYSATRPYNQWSRILNITMAIALVAAWPTTWVMDRAHLAHRTTSTVTGKLFENPDGRIWGWITPPSAPEGRGDAVFHGAFHITVQTEDRGWPFVTTQGRQYADMNVELFAEGRSLAAGDLRQDSPVRTAIERVLVGADHADAVAALWGGEATGVDAAGASRPRVWVANGIVWSMILVIAVWLIVSVTRVGALFVALARLGSLPIQAAYTSKEERRHLRGQCVSCGYDLRGSDFSERCPECGTLVS